MLYHNLLPVVLSRVERLASTDAKYSERCRLENYWFMGEALHSLALRLPALQQHWQVKGGVIFFWAEGGWGCVWAWVACNEHYTSQAAHRQWDGTAVAPGRYVCVWLGGGGGGRWREVAVLGEACGQALHSLALRLPALQQLWQMC